MVKDSRLCAVVTRGSTVRTTHLASERKKLSAEMTATLSVELAGRVPDELIAEVVTAVLDESRQAVQDREVELTMIEARKRVERFIRARARASA